MVILGDCGSLDPGSNLGPGLFLFVQKIEDFSSFGIFHQIHSSAETGLSVWSIPASEAGAYQVKIIRYQCYNCHKEGF